MIVLLAIGYPTYSYIQHNKKIQANEAFTTLLEDPSQKDLYKKLSKDNPQLAQIAKYLNGQIQTIQVPYLKELATLQQTLETQQTKQLQNLSMQKDFLLKEYASFHKALIEAKNSEFDKAKQTLEGISDDSEINNLVTLLEHYLLTK